MTDRPLRAVKAGEKLPAKKAPAKRVPRVRTVVQAAKLSPKSRLEALRDRLAAAIDDPRAHPRDIGNLSKQFLDVCDKLDALGATRSRGTTTAQPSAIADTPNESWDEDAI